MAYLARRGPYSNLENSTPIRHDLDAIDSVAAAFRRQPDRERDAIGRERPWLAHHALEHIRIDVSDNDVLEEQDDQDQDHGRNIDAAEIGQK